MRHLLKAVFVYGALGVPCARTRTPGVSGLAIADGDVALEAQIEDWRSRWHPIP